MMDSRDLSPGSFPWDTNRTNWTRFSGGKYESAHFFKPALCFQRNKCLIANRNRKMVVLVNQ